MEQVARGLHLAGFDCFKALENSQGISVAALDCGCSKVIDGNAVDRGGDPSRKRHRHSSLAGVELAEVSGANPGSLG